MSSASQPLRRFDPYWRYTVGARTWRKILLICITALYALELRATEPEAATDATGELTLEELTNIQVTSVSKKETNLYQSPAAVSVITSEDVRRSGLTSLPELLRMVPGLDVARINANQWAISSRGFNNQYANKLLVLVDGRAVYTPSFGGVFWNAQDLVLEDLDRIEVIRGPGASLWGANAVNGVINVTTKSAKETQGTLLTTTAGTEDQPSTSIRYGGQIGTNLYYRAYVKYFNRDGLVDPMGNAAPDDWNSIRGGARLDWEPSSANQFTLQGDYYRNEAGANIEQPNLSPPAFVRSQNLVAHNWGGNLLGRYTHTFSETSQLTVQAYYDHLKQDDGLETLRQTTYDFDLQHRFALLACNDIIWGAGYRRTSESVTRSFFASVNPQGRQLDLFNVFVQDDVTIVANRLHITLGSKFEHNDLTGFEIQPSARLLWTPSEHQTVWMAASRAIRTPAIAERDSRVNVAAFQPAPQSPPILVSAFGNPNAEAEELIAYELGYRIEPTKRLSFDAAVFYNVYDNLLTTDADPTRLEANPPPFHILLPSTFQNSQSGETYGSEVSAQWRVTDHWRLVGSYSWLQMHLRSSSVRVAESPQQQVQMRSYLELPYHLELNGAAYFVDRIQSQAGLVQRRVPSYLRFDVGLTWHPTKSVEVGIWGQNLFDNQHPEAYSYRTSSQTEVPRGVMARITLRF